MTQQLRRSQAQYRASVTALEQSQSDLVRGVATALNDALYLVTEGERGAVGSVDKLPGNTPPNDDAEDLIPISLAVLSANLPLIPAVVERTQPGALILAVVRANEQLAHLDAPEVPLPADGEPEATGQALRSALVELRARGWPPEDENEIVSDDDEDN